MVSRGRVPVHGTSDDYFRDDVPCYRGSGLGSDEGVLSEVRGSVPP